MEEEEKINKKNNLKIKNLFLFLIVFVLVGGIVYMYKPGPKLNFSFPYPQRVDPLNGISCKAMAGSMMYGSSIGQDKGIHAELFKGTDEMAIELSNNKFSFITKAAVGIGQAKSDEDWKVVLNNENYIIAILSEFNNAIPIRNYTDTFMLNKKNGIAIWNKNRVVNLGTDTPETQSYILQCN